MFLSFWKRTVQSIWRKVFNVFADPSNCVTRNTFFTLFLFLFFFMTCHLPQKTLLLNMRTISLYACRFLPLHIHLKWMSSCLLLNYNLLLVVAHLILLNVKLLTSAWGMNSVQTPHWNPIKLLLLEILWWKLCRWSFILVCVFPLISPGLLMFVLSRKVFHLTYYIKGIHLLLRFVYSCIILFFLPLPLHFSRFLRKDFAVLRGKLKAVSRIDRFLDRYLKSFKPLTSVIRY